MDIHAVAINKVLNLGNLPTYLQRPWSELIQECRFKPGASPKTYLLSVENHEWARVRFLLGALSCNTFFGSFGKFCFSGGILCHDFAVEIGSTHDAVR